MLERLLQFLKVFWSFAKGAQDAFVARLESSSNLMVIVELHVFCGVLSSMVGRVEVLFVAGNKVGQRRPWYVLGKLVSPTCALALLGMGLDRYNRIMQHRRDMRKSDGTDIWHSLVRHSSQINHVVSQDVFAFPPILNPAISLLSAGPCSFQFKSFNLRHELGQRAREGGSIFPP